VTFEATDAINAGSSLASPTLTDSIEFCAKQYSIGVTNWYKES
jgi:hypothetical protein